MAKAAACEWQKSLTRVNGIGGHRNKLDRSLSTNEKTIQHEIDGLKDILDGVEQEKIYVCIQDILAKSADFERLKSHGPCPSRQDFTRFILAWLKHIGVSADRCIDWITGYATRVLIRISSSSASQIRHSTKSLIKYIYGSDTVSFDCGCEENEVKAACDPGCPVYEEMKQKYAIRLDRLANPAKYFRPAPPLPEPLPPVKERYKEQFEKAMAVVVERMAQACTIAETVRYLNDQEYKTRTGKPWKDGILNNEMKKLNMPRPSKEKAPTAARESIKDRFRARYGEARKLIEKMHRDGMEPGEILGALEAAEYTTITGRRWSIGNIQHVITDLKPQV